VLAAADPSNKKAIGIDLGQAPCASQGAESPGRTSATVGTRSLRRLAEEGAEAPALSGPPQGGLLFPMGNLLAWRLSWGFSAVLPWWAFTFSAGLQPTVPVRRPGQGVMGLVGTLASKRPPSRFSVQTPKPVRPTPKAFTADSASVGFAFCRLHRRPLAGSRRSPGSQLAELVAWLLVAPMLGRGARWWACVNRAKATWVQDCPA